MSNAYANPMLADLANECSIEIIQRPELARMFLEIDQTNFYEVKSIGGRYLFAAQEVGGCCLCIFRQCCKENRNFTLNLKNANGQHAIVMKRPMKCCHSLGRFLLPCCRQQISVESPPGQFIGSFRQHCSLIRSCFGVYDNNDELRLRITGPCCVCDNFCCSIIFSIYNLNGDKVGHLKKKSGDILKTVLTNADTFEAEFPMDLAVELKAILLSGVFLIDFVYFESS